MKSESKYYSFDILRVLACFMVVVYHSAKPGMEASQHGVFLSSLSFFFAPCVPIFFMLSGALLLERKIEDPFVFLRKRFNKFISPIIIWTVLYLINKVIIHKINSTNEFFKSVFSIPFSAQEGVLWFMYALAGLYLLTPILSVWLNNSSKRVIEFYLGLWVISLLFPYFENYLNLHTNIFQTADILYYFSGFIGYYVLGYYIKRFYINPKRKVSKRSIIILASICVFFTLLKAVDKTFHIGFDDQGGFGFQSLSIGCFTVLWWIICDKLASTKLFTASLSTDIVNFIANLSFGVYLSHILIMRPWLWDSWIICHIDNYILQTWSIVFLDFGLSLVLCWLISLTPISKYVIGYQQQSFSIDKKVTGAF